MVRTKPPTVDLAISVQNVAEATEARIHAPAKAQSFPSGRNEVARKAKEKTKTADTTATTVTLNFSHQIFIRPMG
jgi:hypothetical protein